MQSSSSSPLSKRLGIILPEEVRFEEDSNPPTGMSKGRENARGRGGLWKGPQESGITYSLLSRFLVCPERFRLYAIEGLRTRDAFNHRIEYGQMFHCCEEAYYTSQAIREGKEKGVYWEDALTSYCQRLCARYPLSQKEIDHWYRVCLIQFQSYLRYWSTHQDVRDKVALFQEKVFSVPYTLPSGRIVTLRGKMDGVDYIPSGENAGVWLQENKTKGDIVEHKMRRQLTCDLQTMMYLVALEDLPIKADIAGVRYNVIRRPLSGGRGTIRQTQKETAAQFYLRLKEEYIDKEPGYYFMRWNVRISSEDIARFKVQVLNPILERLWDWWEFIRQCEGNPWVDLSGEYPGIHWLHPYGVYNPLLESQSTEYDEYLATGSEAGLERMSTLFEELS